MIDDARPSISGLYARWQKGDKDAGNELFRRLHEAVGAMVGKRFGHGDGKSTPEDCAQSVLMSFLRLIRDGVFELRDTPGIFAYLKLLVLGKRHKRDKSPRCCGLVEGCDCSASGPAPGDEIEWQDDLDHLFKRLKPATRQLVRLILLGHTMDEIRVEMHCGRHTVRRHLNRLRVVFRDMGTETAG